MASLRAIFEVTVLITILCAVVVLFTGPIVVFYTAEYTDVFMNQHQYIHAPTNMTPNFANDCNLTWGSYETKSTVNSCPYTLYTGTICEDILEKWQLCATEQQYDEPNINSLVNQQQNEDLIVQLYSLLAYDEECQSAALLFLCQYLFPLHDCSSGTIYIASKEYCTTISTEICAQPWDTAKKFGYELPNCDKLPSNEFNDSNDDTVSLDDSNNDTSTEIICKEDFININSTCIPRCDKFEYTKPFETKFVIAFEVIASGIALIASILIIALSIKDYKKMFTYPNILVIFQAIDCIVLALATFIMAIDRSNLMCSSISLLDTLTNPTPYCTISGAAFHYGSVNWAFWWFFLVLILFHKIAFPFHAHRMTKDKKDKYVFIAIVIISLTVPLPAVIISLAVKEYNYYQIRFPPTFCISSKSMTFYSEILIVDIIICIGVCLLVLVFWFLYKGLQKRGKGFNTAEKKVILVIISFTVFSVFKLARVSNTIAVSDRLTSALTEYFKCEAFGHVPGRCSRELFERHTTPYFSAFSFLLLGLIPLSILNFVFKWSSVKKAKEKFTALFKKRQSTTITNSSN